MLYAYDAQTAFELSLAEGERVEVVEEEDEAGWVKVRAGDGRVGLVPGSYLEEGGVGEGQTSEQGQGQEPSVEGGAVGGGQVTALFDYEAQGPDELSIGEGEVAELTAIGADYGDGWAEVSGVRAVWPSRLRADSCVVRAFQATKDGRTGLLPLSYLRID